MHAGLSSDEIDSRIARGRLHRTWRGVYAVGRPQLTSRGWWTAAVLACGPCALLSHVSAAALWGIWAMKENREKESRQPGEIHVSVLGTTTRSRPGVRVYRRRELPSEDRTLCDRIPVTSPARTLVDLGSRLSRAQLEAAVNEADRLGLIDPESLRSFVDRHRGSHGVSTLRKLLDRRTFSLTDSELERRFIRLVERAGLPSPWTQQRVNGFRVDFYWPDLGLVVETDGLRYHRTATQQARDRQRDQAHTSAGLTSLRFTHAQVAFQPAHVVDVLRVVAKQCRLRIVGSAG